MMRLAALLVALACALPATGRAEGALTVFPAEIDSGCRGGRAKIYDECGDQNALFQAALAEANRQGKVLLVSYGAEWCIWCHVFEAYVNGETDQFTHTFSDPEDRVRDTATIYERAEGDVSGEARVLAAFVADSFVLVHLDTRYAPGADAALAAAGLDPYERRGLPFIFTVTPEGRFAQAMDDGLVETRREGFDWFRGYNRVKLLSMLRVMAGAAR